MADEKKLVKLHGAKVYAFATGQMACFVAGEQVPVLQKPWIVLWAEHAEREGYDPSDCLVEFQSGKCGLLHKLKDGSYGWEVLDSLPVGEPK